VGDPRTLFWLSGSGQYEPMRLAAEMIVNRDVEDDFGQPAEATSTFLRYELELAYEEPRGRSAGRYGNVRLVRESLGYISKGQASSRLPWNKSKMFIDNLIINNRRATSFISTNTDSADSHIIQVHQDGGSRGQPRKSAADRTQRTVVSTTNTSDDPTILAAKREMQQWRKLALEPSAMRAPDSVTDDSVIGANGSHLAAALSRLEEHDADVVARVAATASALTDVREIEVDFDPARDILTLTARIGTGPFLPARALSEGTLRFLALSVIDADSAFAGVLCMEEPENGIHPGKIASMVDLLRSLAVDVEDEIDTYNPLRQVIVNTHSPHFVLEQEPDDLLLAVPVSIQRNGQEVRSMQLLPLSGSWRDKGGVYTASKLMITEYLTLPEGAPMQLSEAEAASVSSAA
jgi:predicted ATPase